MNNKFSEITIVYIEDSDDVRFACEQTLTLAGYRVISCCDAEHSIPLIQSQANIIILTDVRLPGISGLELLSYINEMDSKIPVILITGHGDVEMAVDAMRNGAFDFIEKPSSLDKLLSIIARAVEKRRLVLENQQLLANLQQENGPVLIGRSPQMQQLRKMILNVADTGADVLIYGETGCGKEVVARMLHHWSTRRQGQFVALNCAGLPETLFESEIFGHEAGAFTGAVLAPDSIDGFSHAFGSMASAFGNNWWQTAGLAITFIIMVLGISNGIERINKLIMPLFFFLFFGLAVYMAFQPHAADGYRYIFRIDRKGLLDPMTWVFALGQAFFSLSLAGNGTLIYGSYLEDTEDVMGAAWKVALFDTLAALLAAFVIIPAMAAAGSRLDQGGPGLIFIFLPNLFKSMPGSRILVAAFFVAVLFAGISSLINLFEAPIATMEQQLSMSRKTAVTAMVSAGFVIGICIQGMVADWMDFVSIYICPLGAALAGIMFFWVCGWDYVQDEVGKGRMHGPGKCFSFMARYVFCGLTVLVFILGISFGGIG